MKMAEPVWGCCSSPSPLLLPLFLTCLLVLSSPPSRAEDAGNSSVSLNSNSTATLNSTSTTAMVQNPAISLALSLGLSQELNPNPFINPRPTLSLSLSLSVSEEIRGNPFDFLNLPPSHPDHQEQAQQQADQDRQLLKQGNSDDKEEAAKGGRVGVGRGKCTYSVSIKTSCSSPRATRDAVSLHFGDAHSNQVYAGRLDDPASGTFDRCSIDTFRVVGPCGGRTCYLFLRRSGRDGWTPEYARVFYQPPDPRAAVTFSYNAPLPDGVWYGFNLCHDRTTSSSPVTVTAVDDDDDDGGGGGNDPTIKVKTKVTGSVKTVIFKI